MEDCLWGNSGNAFRDFGSGNSLVHGAGYGFPSSLKIRFSWMSPAGDFLSAAEPSSVAKEIVAAGVKSSKAIYAKKAIFVLHFMRPVYRLFLL